MDIDLASYQDPFILLHDGTHYVPLWSVLMILFVFHFFFFCRRTAGISLHESENEELGDTAMNFLM